MAADRATSRMVAIWGLAAQQAAGRGSRVAVADVCLAAVTAVAVSGAGLTVVTQAWAVHLMCVTDEIS